MVLRSPGVRTSFRLDADVPFLRPAERYRLIRRVQRGVPPRVRRQIGSPTRRNLPRDSGNLRRSFRVLRGRRPQATNYFTAVVFRFNYYFYFQDREWNDFRDAIERLAGGIIAEEIQNALREEGL